jgi:choline transport protein
MAGWQICIGWQADLAVVFYLGGTTIQAMAVLNYPDYGFQRWHGTLILWGIIIIAIGCNTVLARWLSWIEGGILAIHCLGFIIVLVPLLYYGPRVSAHDVFAQYLTLGGYSPGTSFFLGLITSAFAFMGADGAIHMCEEVRNARTAVPYALQASVFINGCLGFGMMIAVLFTIGDLESIEAILSPVTGSVFVDYFNNTLGDAGWATGLTTLLLVIFIFCAVSVLASTSRITWALARDDGLPGSYWIKKV